MESSLGGRRKKGRGGGRGEGGGRKGKSPSRLPFPPYPLPPTPLNACHAAYGEREVPWALLRFSIHKSCLDQR